MYEIVYTDPPWPYNNQQSHDPSRGGYKYENLSLKTISKIPYSEFMAKDSLIFMWVTGPKINDICKIIVPELEKQGFNFITKVFSWVKLNPTGDVTAVEKDIWISKGLYSGMGYWTCGNTEDVWLFKRGNPKRITKDVKQVVFAPRSTHSTKPVEIKSRIVDLIGNVPRLEMFARERTHGFHAWGNEIQDSDIDLTLENGIWKYNHSQTKNANTSC